MTLPTKFYISQLVESTQTHCRNFPGNKSHTFILKTTKEYLVEFIFLVQPSFDKANVYFFITKDLVILLNNII